MWHKQLEAVLVRFRPLLAQAEAAEAMLSLGKAEALGAGHAAPTAGQDGERPPSASSSKSGKSGKDGKKKKDDAPEPPDQGRGALYTGLAAYVRCIEMLRDPSEVRRQERLRTGGVVDISDAGGKPQDGLTQKVGRIRSALALDVALSLPEAVAQANRAMGMDDAGKSLPEQTERLVTALGLR